MLALLLDTAPLWHRSMVRGATLAGLRFPHFGSSAWSCLQQRSRNFQDSSLDFGPLSVGWQFSKAVLGQCSRLSFARGLSFCSYWHRHAQFGVGRLLFVSPSEVRPTMLTRASSRSSSILSHPFRWYSSLAADFFVPFLLICHTHACPAPGFVEELQAKQVFVFLMPETDVLDGSQEYLNLDSSWPSSCCTRLRHVILSYSARQACFFLEPHTERLRGR